MSDNLFDYFNNQITSKTFTKEELLQQIYIAYQENDISDSEYNILKSNIIIEYQ